MHLIRLGKLGILCALLVGCGIEGLGQREVQIPAGVPPALLHDVVFEGFSSGIRDAVVTAAVARIDTERRVALLREVEISFREELRGRVEIRAEEGTLDLDSEDFLLRGGVEGVMAAGDRFHTTQLAYERPEERLSTRAPVRLERSSMTIRAEGMEFDLAERRVHLTGPVTAVVGERDPVEQP